MAFHNYRVMKLTGRGLVVEPDGDDFLSVSLPEEFVMGSTVGAGPRPIELSSDRSAEITVTVGERTPGHVTCSRMWLQQKVVVEAGGRPMGDYVAVLPNGDSIVGRGVINRPTEAAGGTSAGNRVWVVRLSEARYVPAPDALSAELAVDGGV